MKSTDSVIVSWDFSRGKDVGVLIVGSQKNGRVDVINAYQGKEAYELYRKLTIQKKGPVVLVICFGKQSIGATIMV